MSNLAFKVDPNNKAVFEFKKGKTKKKGGPVTLVGMANKLIVDRAKQIIPLDAWDLENFRKNPIIFFNHNSDMPIGKGTDIKVTKDGLKIDVALSTSNEAPMPFIRDLVNEGILKTFSVGFDPRDSHEQDGDTTVIKDVELLEVSIVTLPENQDSTFVVTSKMLKVCKNYSEAKQLWSKSVEEKTEKDSEENAEPKGIHDDDEDEKDENTEDDKEEKSQDGDDDDKEEKEKKEKDETKTDDAEKTDDDDDSKEKSVDDEDDKKAVKQSLAECVANKIPILISEGMEQDQAIGEAINRCQAKGSCKFNPTNDEWNKFISIADNHKKQQDGTEPILAVGLDKAKDPSDFGSPALDLAKAQLAMLGKIATSLDVIMEQNQKQLSLMTDLFQQSANSDKITEGEPSTENIADEETEIKEFNDEDEDEDEKNLTDDGEKMLKIIKYSNAICDKVEKSLKII